MVIESDLLPLAAPFFDAFPSVSRPPIDLAGLILM